MNLSNLTKGQKAVIESFTDFELSLKFLEMGCIPGETVTLNRIAPLGDPISITVSGYELSMRKAEASTIIVRLLN